MRIFTFQILGSSDNIYHTRLMEDGNHFYHTCTCPSSHNKQCKHVKQLLSGDTSSVVEFDQIVYENAIYAISSFKRGIHTINKARVRYGLTPLCRVCKSEMNQVIENVNWFKKLLGANNTSRKKYVCNYCKQEA